MTDQASALSDRYTLEVFGTLLNHQGGDSNPYIYAGEPLDSNSNFYYNRARWMDSRAGRFASVDPALGAVSRPASLHDYAYAEQSPSVLVDPSGRSAEAAIAIAVIATVAILGTVGPAIFNHFSGTEEAKTLRSATT